MSTFGVLPKWYRGRALPNLLSWKWPLVTRRDVWPVSLLSHPVANVASSNAVQEVLHQFPWADSCPLRGQGQNPLMGLPVLVRMLRHLVLPPPKPMPSASRKAEEPKGKAASPGRPASESAAADKGEKESTAKASTTVPKAASSTPKADTTQSGTATATATGAASVASTPQPKASETGSVPAPTTSKASPVRDHLKFPKRTVMSWIWKGCLETSWKGP